MGSISVRSRENGLERSSGDVQTGDGSSALLSSQLGGQDGEVKVVKMTEPEGHRCSKDKTGVILHKFKLKLKERMQSNLDKNWSKIWKKKNPYLSASCLEVW